MSIFCFVREVSRDFANLTKQKNPKCILCKRCIFQCTYENISSVYGNKKCNLHIFIWSCNDPNKLYFKKFTCLADFLWYSLSQIFYNFSPKYCIFIHIPAWTDIFCRGEEFAAQILPLLNYVFFLLLEKHSYPSVLKYF